MGIESGHDRGYLLSRYLLDSSNVLMMMKIFLDTKLTDVSGTSLIRNVSLYQIPCRSRLFFFCVVSLKLAETKVNYSSKIKNDASCGFR